MIIVRIPGGLDQLLPERKLWVRRWGQGEKIYLRFGSLLTEFYRTAIGYLRDSLGNFEIFLFSDRGHVVNESV